MRSVGLMIFALALLTFEGSLLAFVHVEFFRPDLILILVVFVALKSEPVAGSVNVFLLGLIADSFAGIHTGVLTGAYLMIWTLVRIAKSFFLPQQKTVQLVLVFVCSLMILAYVQLLWPSLGIRQGGFWEIGGRGVLLALVNTLLTVPIWSFAGKIVGESELKRRTIFLETR